MLGEECFDGVSCFVGVVLCHEQEGFALDEGVFVLEHQVECFARGFGFCARLRKDVEQIDEDIGFFVETREGGLDESLCLWCGAEAGEEEASYLAWEGGEVGEDTALDIGTEKVDEHGDGFSDGAGWVGVFLEVGEQKGEGFRA